MSRLGIRIWIIIGLAAASAWPARAVPILDAANDTLGGAGFSQIELQPSSGSDPLLIYQTFTAQNTGQLTSLSLFLRRAGANVGTPAVIDIGVGKVTNGLVTLASLRGLGRLDLAAITRSDFYSVDFLSSFISLGAGESYFLAILSTFVSPPSGLSIYFQSPGAYAAGRMGALNANPDAFAFSDLVFRSFVEPTRPVAVPAPGVMALLPALGLLGCLRLRQAGRRRMAARG